MEVATLAASVRSACSRWADRSAITFEGYTATYRTFYAAVDRLASTYRELGIGRADRVVCQASNIPEHLVAMAACWASGAIYVGADHRLTPRELSRIVEHVRPAAIVYEPRSGGSDAMRPLEPLLEAYPRTKLVLAGVWSKCMGYRNVPEFRDWPSYPGSQDAREPDPRPEDPALILLTSGTTGVPKSCLKRQANFAAGCSWLGRALGAQPNDVHLGQLPFSHGFGLQMATIALMTGGRLVLMRRFSAEAALRLIADEGITILHGTPATYILLLQRLDAQRNDISSLRIGAGSAARFPRCLLRQIYDELGMAFMHMYGSSEGFGLSTFDRNDVLLGSVGRPWPGMVAIVDENRKHLPLGHTGEIAFNRRWCQIDYWTEEKAILQRTRDSVSERMPPEPAGLSLPISNVDDYYYTGDCGRLDSQGRLFVLGRMKHQINRGGLKIDASEVEEVLLSYPGIIDVSVIGGPNPVLGHSVCAFVVTANPADLTLDDLRSFCSETLAPFKLPEELYVLEFIPRTDRGKVDMQALHAHLALHRSR